MLTPDTARAFADSWYASWNAHDLDRIMSHYDQGIEHSSPFIARYHTDPKAPSIKGIDVVRGYFAAALGRNPTLAFLPEHLALGIDTVTLIYRRMTGDLAAEIFFFDDAGKIVRSISHYGVQTPSGRAP